MELSPGGGEGIDIKSKRLIDTDQVILRWSTHVSALIGDA